VVVCASTTPEFHGPSVRSVEASARINVLTSLEAEASWMSGWE
jgi:hypothetical protein